MSNYIFLQNDVKQKKKEFQGQTTAPVFFYGALIVMQAATLMHPFAAEQYLAVYRLPLHNLSPFFEGCWCLLESNLCKLLATAR